MTLSAPSNGAGSQTTPLTLSWGAATGATAYDVYLGTTTAPAIFASGVTTTSYSTGTLGASQTFYWYVVARNGGGQATPSATWSFTTAAAGGGGGGGATQLDAPTFSPAPSTYGSPTSVTLSAASGATIRYTTDGSTPSETNGTVYVGAFVASSETINAIAYQTGLQDSPVTSGAYYVESGGNLQSATYATGYAYDLWNNLKTVSMTRPTGTQTRTFTYVGPYLQSATNPENGTVSYSYNAYNKVSMRTDAKGQQVVYTYDTLARLTKVQRYPTGISNGEDVCQQENYYYDTNPYDSTYSGSYTSGRLTAVQCYGGSSAYGSFGYFTGTTACDTQFIEMYGYSQPGGKIGKRLRIIRNIPNGSTQNPTSTAITVDLNSTNAFDNEGRIIATQYPSYGSSGTTAGPNLGWAFDTMGRYNTMTDLTASSAIISGATYGPSSELLSISGSLIGESRSYNSMLQLTSLTVGAGTASVNMSYSYSANQNNGKVTSQTDNVSGEQVTYTYDALNRLATAQATSAAWGQSYTYDGFGNLTDQNVIAGSAPMFHAVYNPLTNNDSCADANGNETCFGGLSGYGYDVENRLRNDNNGFFKFSYAPGNKRIWRGEGTGGNGGMVLTSDEVAFWGVSGQKLATYQLVVTEGTSQSPSASMFANQTGTNYYFGGKLIKNASGYLATDRLGSIGKYCPFGQEKGTGNPATGEKFTGYFRDGETGLDYADQRYHAPGVGRFMTPDPYMARGGGDADDPGNPGSWNRYAYVQGDPIKLRRPRRPLHRGTDPTDGTPTW